MNSVVVDASVAVKWLPPHDQEPLAAEARVLLAQWANGQIHFLAPDLLWAEVANVLWKSVRQKRSTASDARAALLLLCQQDLLTVSSEPYIDLALGIALQHGRTVYDGLYIALAVSSHSQLVTADEKLANAVGASLPVKWLGTF